MFSGDGGGVSGVSGVGGVRGRPGEGLDLELESKARELVLEGWGVLVEEVLEDVETCQVALCIILCDTSNTTSSHNVLYTQFSHCMCTFIIYVYMYIHTCTVITLYVYTCTFICVCTHMYWELC